MLSTSLYTHHITSYKCCSNFQNTYLDIWNYETNSTLLKSLMIYLLHIFPSCPYLAVIFFSNSFACPIHWYLCSSRSLNLTSASPALFLQKVPCLFPYEVLPSYSVQKMHLEQRKNNAPACTSAACGKTTLRASLRNTFQIWRNAARYLVV